MWNSPRKYLFYDDEDFLRQNENCSSKEHVTRQHSETSATLSTVTQITRAACGITMSPTTALPVSTVTQITRAACGITMSPTTALPVSTVTQVTRATSGTTMSPTEHGYITQSSPTQFPSSLGSYTDTIKSSIPEAVSGTAPRTEQRPHPHHVLGTADENIMYSVTTDPSYYCYGHSMSSADFNQQITTRAAHLQSSPLPVRRERTTTQFSPMLPTSLLQSSARLSDPTEMRAKTREFRGLCAAPGVKRQLTYEETEDDATVEKLCTLMELHAQANLGLGRSSPTPVPSYGMSTLTPVPSYGMSAPMPVPSHGMSASTPVPSYGMSAPTPVPSHGMSAPTPVPSYGMSAPTPVPSHGMSAPTPVSIVGSSPHLSVLNRGAIQEHGAMSPKGPITSYGMPDDAPISRYSISNDTPIHTYDLSDDSPVPNYELPIDVPISSYGLVDEGVMPSYGIHTRALARCGMAFQGPILDQVFQCNFCKRNGERRSVYMSHKLQEHGRVTCPILQRYVCPLCGATGYAAHTVSYCPLGNRTSSITATRTLRKSCGCKRICKHGYEYCH